MGPPNISGKEFPNKHTKKLKNEETRNLRRPVFVSKVVNPFTRALGPLL
jgi:hypothetical protein